jgi:hypothetical protein
MPYIQSNRRSQYDNQIDALIATLKNNCYYNSEDKMLGVANNIDGEMNYILTRLIDGVYSNFGYHEYNRAIGIIEGVKLELYRRRIAKYEDTKIKDNGDVYLNE